MNTRHFLLVALCALFLTPSCVVSKKKYEDAQSSIKMLRKNNRNLNDQIKDMGGRIELMEDANQAAAKRIDQQDSLLTSKKERLSSQTRHLKHLQRLINRQKLRTKQLQKSIKKALGGFKAEDLSVYKKNGKVHVRMSEKLLFPSGSAKVNKKGKEALEKLAEALKKNKDINILVQGHTDSIPISVKFKDNWALSEARAASIVRILIKDFYINPHRLTASGRSKYDPVAPNSTASGRAKNRRTEIILEPKLNQLMQLMGENKSK